MARPVQYVLLRNQLASRSQTKQGKIDMQVSASSSAMQMPSTQAMGSGASANTSTNTSSAGNAAGAADQGQAATPLADARETSKMLGAALRMSVLFGEDGNDEESKESDMMAMMMMAAGGGASGGAGGNSYDAMGQMQSGNTVGQTLNTIG